MIRRLADATLWWPAAFDLYQSAIGAPECHRRFITEQVLPRPGQRVLDVGCGVGASLKFIPDGVGYCGIDISPSYIEAARRAHGSRGEFVCVDLQNAGALSGPFDTAFAFGVLHHLPDDAIPALGALLTRVLRPGGTFVSIDPCHVDTQPIWSKCLMAFDRGRHIRTEEGYRQVLGAWGKPSTSTTLDMLRIRYAMAICRVNLAVPDVSRV